ncbi:MAG: type II toxin-antitoxin system RelE/ParE family toxin [Bacteroidota bacterium]|nr:type II toxin-antitoxin system RelE/ParE family toxin [Bacteroidota bacterium]
MSYTYRLHPLTRQDYDAAFAWYEDKQKNLGERFIKAVRQKIEEIILHPEAYGSRSNKTFREAKVEFFPYLIVYKINKRTKEIYISLFITLKNIHEKNIEKNNSTSEPISKKDLNRNDINPILHGQTKKSHQENLLIAFKKMNLKSKTYCKTSHRFRKLLVLVARSNTIKA